MKKALFLIMMIATFFTYAAGESSPKDKSKNLNFYDLEAKDPNGSIIKFQNFRGKIVVLSNIATRCGFTDQLGDLQTLQKKYEKNNVVVLGVPSNNFLSQTPEDNKEVVNFCKLNYKTEFPITEKYDVIGSNKHPIFQWVEQQKGYSLPILWNFEKFIIDQKGNLVSRFRSKTKPMDRDVIQTLEKLL